MIKKLNTLKFCSKLFFAFSLAFIISSCCSEDEPNLSELQICDVQNTELGSPPECESGLSSLSVDAPFITASFVLGGSTPDTEISLRIFQVQNGTSQLAGERKLLASEINDNVEGDECKIQGAYSWSTSSGGPWPISDWEVEVELDNGSKVSKTFSTKS